MKSTASHLAAFVLGLVIGAVAVSKGCPPWPVPAGTPTAQATQNAPAPASSAAPAGATNAAEAKR